jgi:peroxiredoxin
MADIGSSVPSIVLESLEVEEVSLDQYRGKCVVLHTFPLVFTGGWRIEDIDAPLLTRGLARVMDTSSGCSSEHGRGTSSQKTFRSLLLYCTRRLSIALGHPHFWRTTTEQNLTPEICRRT